MIINFSQISIYELVSLVLAFLAFFVSYKTSIENKKLNFHNFEKEKGYADKALVVLVDKIRELPQVDIDSKNLDSFIAALKEIEKSFIDLEAQIGNRYPKKIETIGKIISNIDVIISTQIENPRIHLTNPDLFRKIRDLYQIFFDLIVPELNNKKSNKDGKYMLKIGKEIESTVIWDFNSLFFYYHGLVIKTDSYYSVK
jgi:hypothetical protein